MMGIIIKRKFTNFDKSIVLKLQIPGKATSGRLCTASETIQRQEGGHPVGLSHRLLFLSRHISHFGLHCFVQGRTLTSSMTSGPVAAAIRAKLTESLKPTFLEVINESFMHKVPKGSESHFKVVIVSPCFENQALIKRHRMVNDVLKGELASSVHALSIQARTPSQWAANDTVSKSPACAGGMARERAEAQT